MRISCRGYPESGKRDAMLASASEFNLPPKTQALKSSKDYPRDPAIF